MSSSAITPQPSLHGLPKGAGVDFPRHTLYAIKARQANPSPRAQSDAPLLVEIRRVHVRSSRSPTSCAASFYTTTLWRSESCRRGLDELPADIPIVAYCRGSYCVLPHDAARLLRESGRDAQVLSEGVLEWRANDDALAA